MSTTQASPSCSENSTVSASLVAFGEAAEKEGRHEEALDYYERALSLLRGNQGVQASSTIRLIARTHFSAGRVDAAFDCASLALFIAIACEEKRGEALSLNSLGTLNQFRGELDLASDYYKRAEAVAQEIEDDELVATIRLNFGTVANIRGDFEEALRCYKFYLDGYHRGEKRPFVSAVLNNMGLLYGDLGQVERAMSSYNEAIMVALASEDRLAHARALVNLADLYISMGDVDEAERVSLDAQDLLAEGGPTRIFAEWSKVMGLVKTERGEYQEAEALFETALESAEGRGDTLMLAEVSRDQALLFSKQNRNQETLKTLNRSYQLFQQLKARSDIADLERQMGALEETFLTIVRKWGESIEAADRYTQGHCLRVADYACALAKATGMDRQTLLWFRMGALLHDVGKIIVPPEVLNKPGRFTVEERALMEKHPDAGVELLQGIDFPWDIRPMVRFHHERWGGGGYPMGIAGAEIPLSARILAIADVFDAITTDRPYHKGKTSEECLDIMCNSMQGHFDPELLEIFVSLCRSGKLEAIRQAA